MAHPWSQNVGTMGSCRAKGGVALAAHAANAQSAYSSRIGRRSKQRRRTELRSPIRSKRVIDGRRDWAADSGPVPPPESNFVFR